MTRYKAVISYDGYAFAGFQRQPHARSVQEEIEKTLTKLNKGQAIARECKGQKLPCFINPKTSFRNRSNLVLYTSP